MGSSSRVCGVCHSQNQENAARCMVCRYPLPSTGKRFSQVSASRLVAPDRVLKQRYRVLRVIGQGGMGTVYMGQDLQLGNRLVAIKEMSQTSLSPSERLGAAKSFQQEAHLLAGLHHPHLPSIYDHFVEHHCWYLVMSFIPGQTLTEYLAEQGGKLPVEEVLEIGLTLCAILHYLHTHRPPIIFRDLKPTNVMRTPEGHLYLIDFGIARFFQPGQTKDTAYYGTSGYAPPEQYGFAQTTPCSDIYSLGATLYQLLSGINPTRTHLRASMLPWDTLTIPDSLRTLLTSMLDRDESKRPQQAEDVKQRLQGISNQLATTAPYPPRATEETVSPASSPRRRAKGVLTSSLIAGSAFCLLAILVWFIQENVLRANLSDGVVTAFCAAINSSSPDFQTAYDQFSHTYQQAHSLIDFQQSFQAITQCVVVSYANSKNQADLSITMLCPPPDGPPGGGPPPGGFPPGGPPPGGPPPERNSVDLTLVKDGQNGWKIDSLYVVGSICGFSPGTPSH